MINLTINALTILSIHLSMPLPLQDASEWRIAQLRNELRPQLQKLRLAPEELRVRVSGSALGEMAERIGRNQTVRLQSISSKGHFVRESERGIFGEKGHFVELNGARGLTASVHIQQVRTSWNSRQGLELDLGFSSEIRARVHGHYDPGPGGGVGVYGLATTKPRGTVRTRLHAVSQGLALSLLAPERIPFQIQVKLKHIPRLTFSPHVDLPIGEVHRFPFPGPVYRKGQFSLGTVIRHYRARLAIDDVANTERGFDVSLKAEIEWH